MKNTAKLTDSFIKIKNDLDEGLKRGKKFSELFEVLSTTSDEKELLYAANELFSFDVDSKAVVFPEKFEPSDYYLIFITRLIEISGLKTKLGLKFKQLDNHQILFHNWKDSDQSFRFEIENGQVKYNDQATHQTIFSLDLKNRKMSFDTDTINDFYFISDEENKDSMDQINLFTKLGKILESDYDFDVDFNMFDARNDKVYELANTGLNSDITDELFVESAKNHYTLLNGDTYKGAFLRLKNGVVFSIFQEDAESDQWAIQVSDKKQEKSLFDILKDYTFLNDWYVKNIKELKLKTLF